MPSVPQSSTQPPPSREERERIRRDLWRDDDYDGMVDRLDRLHALLVARSHLLMIQVNAQRTTAPIWTPRREITEPYDLVGALATQPPDAREHYAADLLRQAGTVAQSNAIIRHALAVAPAEMKAGYWRDDFILSQDEHARVTAVGNVDRYRAEHCRGREETADFDTALACLGRPGVSVTITTRWDGSCRAMVRPATAEELAPRGMAVAA
jgi:hypothetical protein